MSAWIISIVGIITLGILVDIVLPEGQTNKYIKGIFAAITILTIIAPIPKFLNNEIDFKKLFSSGVNFSVDDSFIETVSQTKKDYREESIEALLAQMGYEKCEAKIVKKVDKSNEIDYVNIYFNKVVLNEKALHIDIVNNIKTTVGEYLKIHRDCVRVLYE